MGFVTVFCPLTMTAARELVAHAAETRFVVDCRMKPVTLVGHFKTKFVAEGVMVSCGGGSVRLNTVPLPQMPPPAVVPYSVLFNKIKPACGDAPSPLGPFEVAVKVCRV